MSNKSGHISLFKWDLFGAYTFWDMTTFIRREITFLEEFRSYLNIKNSFRKRVFHFWREKVGKIWCKMIFLISAAILKRFNRFESFFSVFGFYCIALLMDWVWVKEPNGKVVSRADKIMGPPPYTCSPMGGHKTVYT